MRFIPKMKNPLAPTRLWLLTDSLSVVLLLLFLPLGSVFPTVQELGPAKSTKPVDCSILPALEVQRRVFLMWTQWCQEKFYTRN